MWDLYPAGRGSLFPGRRGETARSPGPQRGEGGGRGLKGRHCFQACLPVRNRSARCRFKVSIPSKPWLRKLQLSPLRLAAGRGLQGMCDLLARGQSQRVAASARGYLCPARGEAPRGQGVGAEPGARTSQLPFLIWGPAPSRVSVFLCPGSAHFGNTQVEEGEGGPRTGQPADMPRFGSPWAGVPPPSGSPRLSGRTVLGCGHPGWQGLWPPLRALCQLPRSPLCPSPSRPEVGVLGVPWARAGR